MRVLNLAILFFMLILSSCATKNSNDREVYKYSEFEKLNPSLKTSIDKALDKIGAREHQKSQVSFRKLGSGLVGNLSYLFDLNNKRYILHVLDQNLDIKTRKSQIDLQNKLSLTGITPETFYNDSEYKIMLRPYIPGVSLQKKDLNNYQTIKSFAKSLKDLHNYKGNFKAKYDQAKRTQIHYDLIQKNQNAVPSIYSKLYKNYQAETKILAKMPQVLNHGDLSAENIIIENGGKIYLIDWTAATRDNRFADLGYFALINGLTKDQETLLLNSYFGREANKNEQYRFEQSKKRTSFMLATYWFALSENEEDKKLPMQQRVANLDKLMESSDLKTGEQYINEGKFVAPYSDNVKAKKLYALAFLKSSM